MFARNDDINQDVAIIQCHGITNRFRGGEIIIGSGFDICVLCCILNHVFISFSTSDNVIVIHL